MNSASLKVIVVAGARPNFMKVAPLIHAIQRHNTERLILSPGSVGVVRNGGEISPNDISRIEPMNRCSSPSPPSEGGEGRGEVGRSFDGLPGVHGEGQGDAPSRPREIHFRLVHTGQHYDAAMSDVFFRELGIPAPDFNLEVGSGSHAVQTAQVMLKFEPVLLAERPDWVVVVGDVNSTVACALVASKLGIKVAHVEAGLRSFDRSMPEELNRLVTDALADLLLTPSEDANENLRKEGVPDRKIKLVGNIMIDALVANLPAARASQALETFGVPSGGFVYVTLHRPSNVDTPDSLRAIMGGLESLSHRLPVVFPMHPRTRKMLVDLGISPKSDGRLRSIEPIGYLDSLCLTENARLIVTDSGGLQEEATWFRTPCLTLRPNTERPVTLTVGSNRLSDARNLAADVTTILNQERRLGAIPPLWDGAAAGRIVRALTDH